MKVLVLHSRYLSGSTSGENRVVEDELRLLADGGHEVSAWQPSVESTSSAMRKAADSLWSRSATAVVRQLVEESQPDIVHVHSLYPRLSPAVLRVLPRQLPIVMTLHNFRLMCLPATYLRDGSICEECAGRIPWRGVTRACYRGSRPASAALAASLSLHRGAGSFSRVHRFLAVSGFVRDKHIEAGMAPARIRVKSNFAWSTERRAGPGQHLLYLGRLTPEKGLATIVNAVPETLELIVAGDGPERARLEAEASPAVSFLGQVGPDRVRELLRGARALVVPSLWYEGQPRVITEAFAAGVPVLASRIGGLPELINDGGNGYLLSPGRESVWRNAFELVADDWRSRTLGEGALNTWRRRFTPEIALRDLEASYREAIRSYGVRRTDR